MNAVANLLATKRPYLTDGGLETSIIFHEGIDLPYFASFTLLDSAQGRAALRRYFGHYLSLAEQAGAGFVLDTATWRAGTEWGTVMGLNADQIRWINGEAVNFAAELRAEWQDKTGPILVNGVVGPSGDGYALEQALSPETAEARHRVQIDALAGAGADLVTAVTMTHSGEAIGVARAAGRVGIPVAIGFTVETDGRLPSGESMGEAIAATDHATGNAPVSYMINCAHPTHFTDQLQGDWTSRIGAIRANASRMSHAELDAAEELDDGDPLEFGALYKAFGTLLPNLKVIGGCCGTDHRHVGCASAHFHKHAA